MSAVDCGESAEYFNAGGDGNDHGGGGEISACVYVYAYGEYVMGPYDKA